ncbi:MAG TPA: ABC transporter ATP-binding protein [Trichormus sp.]
MEQSGKAVAPSTNDTAVQGQKEPSIRCANLTKIFGERTVVDHLNLAVYPGELYALLGDNGAGKTTSISMLTTLLKPTSGEIFICGFDALKDTEKTKGAFGVVSQDVAIYQELTAFENLSFVADLYAIPKATAQARIEALLEDAQLLDRANEISGTFSGGMQRKLSIAIAMLHQPKVIFMDEPTVGLDPASRRQIWSSLKKLRDSGVSILLTTHYLEEAELLADRIGIIRKGKLVAEGTIEELRHKIQGIRHISIRLHQSVSLETLKPRVDKLLEQFKTEVKYDLLRNTISFAQPKDSQLVKHLHHVLKWLDDENISFSKFATSEPNLEEVFLGLATTPGDADVDKLGDFDIDDV